MRYSLAQIAEITHGTLVGADQEAIERLEVDSRHLTFPSKTLFIALKGPQHDGHRFIDDCIARGVMAFLVEQVPEANDYDLVGFVQVEDTLQALQDLAAYHRAQFDIPIVGITGSNGKTIIKEWLAQLLTPEFNVVKSPKSYNSQVGVPLSVARLQENHSIALFEAGISEPGEMERLHKVIRPTIGVFANIGSAHDAGFDNVNEKIAEKLKLFAGVDTLIYCRDHQEVDALVRTQFSPEDTFAWSVYGDADLRYSLTQSPDSTQVTFDHSGEHLEVHLPFTDDASVENALHCLAVAVHLKMDVSVIAERLEQLHNLPLRLELKKGVGNSTIIYDCYNADLDSLSLALDFMIKHDATGHRTAVLSDFLQSDLNGAKLYQAIAEVVAKKDVDQVIGIGPGITEHKALFPSGSVFYPDTKTLLAEHPPSQLAGRTILLKGARAFQFERIGQWLQGQAHQTVLEINLNALAHNLNVYRARLKPETKVMVMVKALSYGAGSYEIAQLMQFHQVDYLAVAYTDEGVQLRQSGIRLPIMVMNPAATDFALLEEHNLEPEIFSVELLRQYIESGSRGVVHLKLETGMNRLGFSEGDLDVALNTLKQHGKTKVESVFSHLAASDQSQHDQFTNTQLERFEKMADHLSQSLGYAPARHILNSSGIVRFPNHQFEMVRLGIGLYGIDTSRLLSQDLEPISALRTVVSQVKTVEPGESVGYDRAFVADKPMRVAVIGIGYADGFKRSLGNHNGFVIIHGQKAPVVGNVCMDMTMVDVTGLPNVSVGDNVEVFGPMLPVEVVAARAGTTAYEIISTISSRVRRVYLEE